MKTVARILTLLAALVLAIISFRFFNFEVQDILEDKGSLVENPFYNLGFYTHIGFGILALVTGPSQFFPGLRNRFLKAHRYLGFIYFIAVLISAISGLVIAFFATGGWVASLGFIGLSLAWLFTSFKAYSAIRNKNIIGHEAWVHRSYAVTFAAVSLRLILLLFMGGFGWTFLATYKLASWASWIVNLLIMELYVCNFISPRATE